jgi:hypothetical protein
MTGFVAGATTLAYLAASLFFLRFWRDARDRLFAIFAMAFAVLGLNRLLLALVAEPPESRTWFFLVRLLAYLLILAAILDKNRTARRRADS